MDKKAGFTLIELLVVMGIMAILVAIGLPNYLGMRQRANDTKKKAELQQMKNALRLYYADYQKYPAPASTYRKIAGCGTLGDTQCPTCSGVDFSAGGVTGCDNVYMKKFTDFAPTNVDTYGWNYRNSSVAGVGQDEFCLSIQLENTGDADIVASQQRCPSSKYGNCTGATTYCVCSD